MKLLQNIDFFLPQKDKRVNSPIHRWPTAVSVYTLTNLSPLGHTPGAEEVMWKDKNITQAYLTKFSSNW
jgi:hypothetical protein